MRPKTLYQTAGGSSLRVLVALATVGLTVFTGAVAVAEQAEISGTANVYLRSGPSADSPTVGVLNAGDKVTVVSSQGMWTRVVTSDSRVGYLNRRFLTPTADSPEAPSATPDAAAAGLGERPSAAAPAPSPSAEEPKQELSAAMAALRAEISELKQKIEHQGGEAGARPDAVTTSVARTPPVAIQTGNDPVTAREQGVGVLAVAILCLIIGWVLGSTFTRRRSRSQRSRLRF